MEPTKDVVFAYLAAWNENDSIKRAALLSRCWADNGEMMGIVEGAKA